MNSAEWKSCMSDLLEGVERELPGVERAAIKASFDGLRTRIWRCIPQRRNEFELELEGLLQSSITLQIASLKYISRILPPTLAAAETTMKEARAILKRFKNG